ncbi:chorismate--pyruvate lyase family protein [Solimicrobium silvestre]|uniref:Probable chorismate pyruvate-lyase n=1 Tax=Solimicrobium silvestre TaxID=2099400 RepID=A0A2S9GUD7_9BURK|nr:chorismate lyase [Solimicrobium silvestre]PRC91347.1 4-hydroxybenzoate synthetase (chorismate lyase) [Solimicrobium silvestre]
MLAKQAARKAQWHHHVNHVQAPKAMRHWLTDAGSLTAKLITHSSKFRVQRVYQQHDFCWADEYTEIGLSKASKVHAREVLLRCDDAPAIYAHTVLPLSSTASQWPLFKALGEKSLGSTLFGDPQVVRGALQFARLQPNHPAMRRAQLLTNKKFDQPLFARRSLFFRRGGVMLVTELFLPAIADLTTHIK